jgi:solute carrier family 25 aspartate/glutamate transporter 12/13
MEQVTEQLGKVKEGVKETLLGHEVEAGTEYSAQTRNEFMQFALKDEESGEYYMTAKEFVDAVAPAGEDYVGDVFRCQTAIDHSDDSHLIQCCCAWI